MNIWSPQLRESRACLDLQTTGSDTLNAYFGLLPIGVGKCQHLPTPIGKSPKWKRLQAFFGLLPPHYGKCWHLPVKPRIYQFSGFYGNINTPVVSVLISYICAAAHFLNFGEMNMRSLHIALFHYRKNILNNFGCLKVSSCGAIRNILTGRFLPWRLVQTCLLETWVFIFKCTVHSEVWFSVSVFCSCFLGV